MRAGKLRHRVTIQSLVEGSPNRTATGRPDATWGTYLTAWASIEPLRGRELIEAHAVQSKLSVRVRMRYRAGVTAAMRVVHGQVMYPIEAVIDVEARGIELHLMCSQGVALG